MTTEKKIWRKTSQSIDYEKERARLEPKHQRQLEELKEMMNYSYSTFGFMDGNKQYIYEDYGDDAWGDDIVGIVGEYTEKLMICTRWLGMNQVYNIPSMSNLSLKLQSYIDDQNKTIESGEAMITMSITTPKEKSLQMYLKTDIWEENPLAQLMNITSERDFSEGWYLWVTKYV